MNEGSILKLLRVLKLNRLYSENLPSPLFAKEGNTPLNPCLPDRQALLIKGNYPSLWQREVRRDFTYRGSYYFETVDMKGCE